MAHSTKYRVVHMERATIEIKGIGAITTPPFISRDVASQKRANLIEATEREARLLGTFARRVRRPKFEEMLVYITEEQ